VDLGVNYAADPRVDAYIDALPDWQQAICREVRDLVHAADHEVAETIKRTNRPYSLLQGNICALLAAKDHVNVFLYDGADDLRASAPMTPTRLQCADKAIVSLFSADALGRRPIQEPERQPPKHLHPTRMWESAGAWARPQNASSLDGNGGRAKTLDSRRHRPGGIRA
jgi:hypothetical protein